METKAVEGTCWALKDHRDSFPLWLVLLSLTPVLQKLGHRCLQVGWGSWGEACMQKACIFGISSSSPPPQPLFVSIVRDSRAVWVCGRFVSACKWNKYCNFSKCASIFWCFCHWVIGLKVTAAIEAKLEIDLSSDTPLSQTWHGGQPATLPWHWGPPVFCWRLCFPQPLLQDATSSFSKSHT